MVSFDCNWCKSGAKPAAGCSSAEGRAYLDRAVSCALSLASGVLRKAAHDMNKIRYQ